VVGVDKEKVDRTRVDFLIQAGVPRISDVGSEPGVAPNRLEVDRLMMPEVATKKLAGRRQRQEHKECRSTWHVPSSNTVLGRISATSALRYK
jgi:hypothetical protein